MSFEVKFQVQIRQKCRSKWNDIRHTLELGLHEYWNHNVVFFHLIDVFFDVESESEIHFCRSLLFLEL